MRFLRQWLERALLFPLARRSSRLPAIERFLESADERYLDVNLWAGMRGLSRGEAHRQLEAGVQMRLLDRCYLYEWDDSPVSFLFPESQLGQRVKLADIGYIGRGDNREILLSPNRVRLVFVAAGTGEA